MRSSCSKDRPSALNTAMSESISAELPRASRSPARGKPTDMIDGATVRARSCMIADALTKIVMICGTDATELLEHYNASALLVSTDGDVRITPDWHHAVHLAA